MMQGTVLVDLRQRLQAKWMYRRVPFMLTLMLTLIGPVTATHFRGGYITWKPVEGTTNQINVTWSLASRNSETGGEVCGDNSLGSNINPGDIISVVSNIVCEPNCLPPNTSATVPCTDFSPTDKKDWKTGYNTRIFSITPGITTLSFEGTNWIPVVNDGGQNSKWRLEAKVDLSIRYNSGAIINTSPLTAMIPVMYTQAHCPITINIPVYDTDADVVRCRWANDVGSIVVPDSSKVQIDESNCSITINSDFPGARETPVCYALAVAIEDFMKPYSTGNTALSTVPLQFLVCKCNSSDTCDDVPVFVEPPTPSGGEVRYISTGNTYNWEIRVNPISSIYPVTSVTTVLPYGVTKSSLQNECNGQMYTTLSWTPTVDDLGAHMLCFNADDGCHYTELRCITLIVSNELSECDCNPCHHGECINGSNSAFKCNCAGTGFEGLFCQIELNECDSNPCLYGECIDRINAFECNCNGTGYEGILCHKDIDECDCDKDNCNPVNGTCTNTIGSFTCSCKAGYDGDGIICTELNECGSNPCLNGECIDQINAFECNCNGTGYEGNFCQIDIDECDRSTDDCNPVNGTCTNTIGSFTCSCKAGYDGDGIICTELNECGSNPCLHGECMDRINTFECNCNGTGYEGFFCQIDIDECDRDKDNCNPVNGTCTNTIGSFTCSCIAGYDGDGIICTELNECDSNPCLYGECVDQINAFECNCNGTGYEGFLCHKDINECILGIDNCNHVNGTCKNTIGSFTCSCKSGYNGDGINCTACTSGKYGIECQETCTCITGALCSRIDGICTCTQTFEGQVCNKANLNVSLMVSETTDKILDGSNITLTCIVNLPNIDIGNQVKWTFPDNSVMYGGLDGDDNGKYQLSLDNIQPTPKYNGNYSCTAVTALQKHEVSEAIDSVTIYIEAPGRIITAPGQAFAELQGDGVFNCTVYGNTAPAITWHGLNDESLEDVPGKIEITEPLMTTLYKTSLLRILNITRNDNGTHKCIANNTATQYTEFNSDSGEYHMFVLEPPEITIDSVKPDSSEGILLKWTITYAGNLEVNCTIGCTEAGGTRLTTETGNSNTMYTMMGLTPYTEYMVDLQCHNKVGSSDLREHHSNVRTNQSAPGVPQNVQIEDHLDNSAYVSWDDPLEPNGPIAYYNITVDSGNNSPIVKTYKQSPVLIHHLAPGTEYTVFVRGVNIENDNVLLGESAEGVHFKKAELPPSAPVGAQAVKNSENCTISWMEPAFPRGDILGYTIHYVIRPRTDLCTGVGEPDGGGAYEGIQELEFQVSKDDLQKFSRYDFEVSARTSAGEGDTTKASALYCATNPGGETPPSLAGPDPLDPKDITSTTFKVVIGSVSSRTGSAGCYEVVVIRLDEDEEFPIDPADFPDFLDWDTCNTKTGCAYSAIVLNESKLKELNGQITIGSEETTTCNDENALPAGCSRRRRAPAENRGAYNGELQPGTSYTAFIRAYIPIGDGQVEHISSPPIDVVTTDRYSVGVVAIAGGVTVAILVCIIIMVVCLVCGRRKRNQPPGFIPDGAQRGRDNTALEMRSDLSYASHTLHIADHHNIIHAHQALQKPLHPQDLLLDMPVEARNLLGKFLGIACFLGKQFLDKGTLEKFVKASYGKMRWLLR
ncbi:uncharacterized protein [Amphiura filiformis]|uniref:uncharacterized protein n=1 Tax=Amphiura filiformis TaxID=82378 RepID=UPI003B210207